MKPFVYSRASSTREAIELLEANPGASIIAGGTNLLDLMKERAEQPSQLIDITRLPGLSQIEATAEGGLRIGALVKNSTAADHALVQQQYPLLVAALYSGASPQLRNAASMGGNLLQRTRCYYFYDGTMPCNKRQPGAGCSAIDGHNHKHAIFGWSDHCVATHPSDMAVALAALDAVVEVEGSNGAYRIAVEELHRLPGDLPQKDTLLQQGDVITAIVLPPSSFGVHSFYLKVRDRASFAFATVSVAAAVHCENGVVQQARLALGGVAHKPWRSKEAEAALIGQPATSESFQQVADIILRDAQPLRDNTYKIPLLRKTIVQALTRATAGEVEFNVAG